MMKNMMNEKELNQMIFAIGELVEQENACPGVFDHDRMKQAAMAYTLMKRLAKDTDMTVDFHAGPSKGMGCITVEGEDIELLDSGTFARAVQFASNVDIYPLVNGRIRMDMTFYGLIVTHGMERGQ